MRSRGSVKVLIAPRGRRDGQLEAVSIVGRMESGGRFDGDVEGPLGRALPDPGAQGVGPAFRYKRQDGRR